VANLPEHPLQLARVLVLCGSPDLPEAERTQSAEMAIGLADAAPDLRDLEGFHASVSPAGAVAPVNWTSTGESDSFSSAILRAPARETGSTCAMVLPRS
jgi:hypothetical protein